MEPSPVHRVKLYKLTGDGGWMDAGTGHISVAYMEQADAMGLIVVSEESRSSLLVHKIVAEDIYIRQEQTIISWHDKELTTEVAVSFEKNEGCEQVWMQIKQAQEATAAAGSDYTAYEDANLPPPEVGNLEEMAKAVCTASIPQHRERLASAMLKPGWIATLLDVFKQCEDLEDTVSLGHVFRIVRGAIMLNEAALLEELLKEDFVMDVVGALEQDPDMPAPQKHREFLATSVVFKEVVPIKDTALLAKIHQTYRIQYIKDVILPRSLDDATYATLSSLALFNNVEVVSALAQDADFLQQLFAALERVDPGGEEWADLVAFLQEFCNLARHLQQSARQQLFSRLVQLGLFEQVTRIMKVGNETTKLRATDVLLSVMQHDTQSLRTFLQQEKDHMLFGLLVREFTDGGGDGGLCEQVAELLKLLLDPETLKEKPDKSEFVDLFYNKFLERILEVILTDKQINPKEGTRHVPASTLALIVDFLCYCVLNHCYRSQYFVLTKRLLTKVLYVMRRPERWLACAAVRFIRAIISTKEKFYINQLVRNNVFEPIFSCFFQNGDRYNLLNSATLELVSYITNENLKDLITHLVQQYSHRFTEVDYVDTFDKLKLKYEQNLEGIETAAADGAGASSGGAAPVDGGPLQGRKYTFDSNGDLVGPGGPARVKTGMRRRWDERGLSQDEEDYFDTDDDEGSSGSASGSGGGAAPAAAAVAAAEDDWGPLLSHEGPYPRPRKSLQLPDSPPSSPKRARPIQFTSGPNVKRRAGSGPILTIAAPVRLSVNEEDGFGELVSGRQRHAVGEREVGPQPRTPIPPAAPSSQGVWQGLTEYEDEEEQQQQEQEQQRRHSVEAFTDGPPSQPPQPPMQGSHGLDQGIGEGGGINVRGTASGAGEPTAAVVGHSGATPSNGGADARSAAR